MITDVALRGFKGLNVNHSGLSACVALHGPMGAGKSAVLQAVRFALDGSMPDGRKDDIVASYFPPCGGTVLVKDDAGRWIKRGVDITRGRAKKVRRVLETSDTDEGAKEADVGAWTCNPILVDVAAFTALSPEKRRQYVLALCGSGRESEEPIIDVVGRYYARELGGSAADHTMLYTPDDWTGYTEDEQRILAAWAQGDASIHEVLQAVMIADESLAGRCAKMMERAGKEVIAYRAQAVQARQAIDELREQAELVRPLVEQLSVIRDKVATAREARDSVMADHAHAVEISESKAAAKARSDAAAKALSEAQESLACLQHPGDAPEEPPAPDIDMNQLEALTSEVARLDKEISDQEALEKRVELAEGDLSRKEEALANHKAAEHGRLADVTASLSEKYRGDELVATLAHIVGDMTAGWRSGLERRERQLREASAALDGARRDALASGSDLESLRSERVEAVQKRERAQAEVSAFQSAYAGTLKAYRSRRDLYDAALDAFSSARNAAGEAERASLAANETLREIEARSVEYEDIDADSIERANAWAEREELRLEEAVAAQGALNAYDEAVVRAHKAELMEEAWKVAKRAVGHAREAVVADAVAPIRHDMDRVYEESGRDERVFMRLENERGTPIFEMGVLRGKDKIPLGPMSDGESTIFLVALTIAIAMRSEGRRVLLVEADHLDDGGLYQTMRALAPWRERLDLVLLATSRTLPEVDGWDIRNLEEKAA